MMHLSQAAPWKYSTCWTIEEKKSYKFLIIIQYLSAVQEGVPIVFKFNTNKHWKCVIVYWLGKLFSVNCFLSKNISAKMDVHLYGKEFGREPQPAASSRWGENPS